MDLSDIHPLAVVAGVIGIGIGIYTVKIAGGGGMAVGEVNMELGIIWKVLIPIACGLGGWFIVQKMAS